MAKDPAFLFYPGDYLKDTQCLSEVAQVAYDRIMCEHMRNISLDMNDITVSKDRVNFFTKKFSEEQKDELLHVLKKTDKGYQIEWVAESICKRKSYSESRSKNRGKKDETYVNTSLHMENEDVINSNISKVKLTANGQKTHKQFRSAAAQGADLYAERITRGLEEKAKRHGKTDTESPNE